MLIAEKTGWTYDEIIEQRAWVNIRMMLADAQTIKRVKKKPIPLSGDQVARALGLS